MAQANRPKWPETLVQNGRHFNWESDLRHYQAQLVAYTLGEDPPPKPPQPEDDRLVPIRQGGVRFGLSRRTVGRLIREQRRPAPPAVPKPSVAAE
jgi:hypothetical protein